MFGIWILICCHRRTESPLCGFPVNHFNCRTQARRKVPLCCVVLGLLCWLRSLRYGMPGGRKLWVSFLWFSVFISISFIYRLSLCLCGWFGICRHKVVNTFIPVAVLFFSLFTCVWIVFLFRALDGWEKNVAFPFPDSWGKFSTAGHLHILREIVGTETKRSSPLTFRLLRLCEQNLFVCPVQDPSCSQTLVTPQRVWKQLVSGLNQNKAELSLNSSLLHHCTINLVTTGLIAEPRGAISGFRRNWLSVLKTGAHDLMCISSLPDTQKRFKNQNLIKSLIMCHIAQSLRLLLLLFGFTHMDGSIYSLWWLLTNKQMKMSHILIMSIAV